MVTRNRRFNFRYDDSFMEIIDHWLENNQQCSGRAEAIRKLALRGAATDKYLALILEKSAMELIASGALTESSEPEIYARFQQVVVDSLDRAVILESTLAQLPEGHDVRSMIRLKKIQEMRAPNKRAPKPRRGRA